MLKQSAWRHRAVALVIAAGAAASVATSMTEWFVEDSGELPPIHLDPTTSVIEYEIRATARGTLEGSGEVEVSLSSAQLAADGNPARIVHATLRSGAPEDTDEVYLAPGITDTLTVPAWGRCPGSPCEESFILRLELAEVGSDGGTDADLFGTVTARRTGVGEQPSDVSVDVSVWSEVTP
jgi:hypothetical protein